MTFQEAKNYFLENYEGKESNSVCYLLLMHLSNKSKLQLLTEDVHFNKNDLADAIARLNENEPIQYITGSAPFIDFELMVNNSVLIPRPETEELAIWCIQHLQETGILAPQVLDIGTGSACIALGIKSGVAHAKIHALDTSAEALNIANKNAEALKLPINFLERDILNFDKYDWENKYDLIVSNPPYVLTSDKSFMEQKVLEHEPAIALFVEDNDPLLFYRKIIEFAQVNLTLGGYLFFEIHEKMAGELLTLLAKNLFSELELRQDLQ